MHQQYPHHIGCSMVTHGSSFLWFELHWKQQILELCKIREVDLQMLGEL